MKIYYRQMGREIFISASLENKHCAVDEHGRVWLEDLNNKWRTNQDGGIFATRVERRENEESY